MNLCIRYVRREWYLDHIMPSKSGAGPFCGGAGLIGHHGKWHWNWVDTLTHNSIVHPHHLYPMLPHLNQVPSARTITPLHVISRNRALAARFMAGGLNSTHSCTPPPPQPQLPPPPLGPLYCDLSPSTNPLPCKMAAWRVFISTATTNCQACCHHHHLAYTPRKDTKGGVRRGEGREGRNMEATGRRGDTG